MTVARPYAAVVLAAGLSSRMGEPKPLLHLGGRTVLERVASALRAADILEIVVVTGSHREEVRAEAERLDLREAHNPGFAAGMFSSVQAGCRALRREGRGFFVLPVDCPLVGPGTLTSLLVAQGLGDPDVTYPACMGRRGHPPLLAGRLRDPLAAADPAGNLREFLNRNAPRASDCDVEDLTVLLDMDTRDDLPLMEVLARSIDHMEAGSEDSGPSLSEEDALRLLRALGVEKRVIRHGQAVSTVAAALADEVAPSGVGVDLALIRAAGVLHDLAKGCRRHAVAAQTLLGRLGLTEIAGIVGTHMVLPQHQAGSSVLSEHQLVYVADKLVVEDRYSGLDARASYARETYGRDEGSLAAIENRISAAATIIDEIERITGRSIDSIVGDRLGRAERS